MSFVPVLVLFVAWVYWMYRGRPATAGGVIAVLIGAVAALATYDGTTLAVREHARLQNGRVMPGTVMAKPARPAQRAHRGFVHPGGGATG